MWKSDSGVQTCSTPIRCCQAQCRAGTLFLLYPYKVACCEMKIQIVLVSAVRAGACSAAIGCEAPSTLPRSHHILNLATMHMYIVLAYTKFGRPHVMRKKRARRPLSAYTLCKRSNNVSSSINFDQHIAAHNRDLLEKAQSDLDKVKQASFRTMTTIAFIARFHLISNSLLKPRCYYTTLHPRMCCAVNMQRRH